jgi:hypothetical protein
VTALRLALTTVALVGAVTLHGSVATFWETATEAEFLRGEVSDLSIDSFGRVTLGPTVMPLYDATAPFVWTVVEAPDGSVFAGSGNEGQVFRVDATGQRSVFFDAEELEVHALALAPGGGLYVGSSPDGKIYKVNASGTAETFFDPEDRYIWSLVVDATGAVFAATGDKGRIYRIAPDGTGTIFYETKATHAMTLAFDRQDRLLAGTESPGRVFRVDATGRGFVLLDSSYAEIRALRVDVDDTIYVAAVNSRSAAQTDRPPSAPQAGGSTATATVSTSVTVVAVAQAPPAPQANQAAAPRGGPLAGAVFRIQSSGAYDLLWESTTDTPYDVALEPGGTILVATGNDGKIFRLAGEPFEPTLVARASAQQVTNLLPRTGGRVLLATSNPGKLLQLSATTATRGTYVSTVRDAGTVAAWGTLRWRQTAPTGSRLQIATRSGNTNLPDDAWSDWSAAYADPDGSAITSPQARYLQFRATLTGTSSAAPTLNSVTVAYLPRNARPRVRSITVYQPGTVFQQPFPQDPPIAGFEGNVPSPLEDRSAAAQASPALGRRTYQKGLLTFIWRADDENGDSLSYDVLSRREGDTEWSPLKRGMTNNILVWDTTAAPDGRYSIRVVASDAPSNSPATALAGARESAAFDVDNVPPAISAVSRRQDGARTIVAFEVSDAHAGVRQVDYSLEGERWFAIYPRDGIADSRVERYELALEGLPGDGAVILRAADALNNTSSTIVEGTAARPSGDR